MGSRARRWGVAAAVTLGIVAASAGVAPPQAPAARPMSVAFMTFECAEGSFFCPPFIRALKATGARGRIIAPDPREDHVGTLSALAQQGHDLVIVATEDSQTVIAEVAPRFPGTRFVLFDATFDPALGADRNVTAVVHRPRQGAYLAGWLAARMERRRAGPDVIGVVGGMSIPPVDEFVVAFAAGARRGAPGVKVLRAYSDDFLDPARCAALARRQIAQGAGIVFNVAGGCGLGTLEAARRAGVWGIGVDEDQSFLGPHILTSVLKGYEAGFVRVIRQRRAGTLPGGRTLVLELRQGGTSLGRISPRVPAELRAGLAAVRREILAGRIRVP